MDVHFSTVISNKSKANTVQKFYWRVNSLLSDFKNVPCHIKTKLLTTSGLDLYASQL